MGPWSLPFSEEVQTTGKEKLSLRTLDSRAQVICAACPTLPEAISPAAKVAEQAVLGAAK